MAARPAHVVLISDVHGHLDKLRQLWSRLEAALGGPEVLRDAHVIFLGDYVDKGPHSCGVLDWLCCLRAARAAAQNTTVFLAGNHDVACSAFLGLLPPARCTSDAATMAAHLAAYTPRATEAPLYAGPGVDGMHLQGARWANGGSYKSYGADATFASYGVPFANRAAMLAAMPQEHQAFLRDLQFVHECELPAGCGALGERALRLIAVHAGLLPGVGVDEQLVGLRARDLSQARVEQLWGRAELMPPHPELELRRTLCVSGHHGTLSTSTWRAVIDTGGGLNELPISAMIFPGRWLVSSDCCAQQP
jgi:hypothetical protein